MASSDLPANDKDDERVPIGSPPATAVETGSKRSKSPTMGPKSDTKNGQTMKSTPPSSGNNTETANKRKRESVAAYTDYTNKETESKHESMAANTDYNNKVTESTKDTPKEKNAKTIETAGVKDVEMKDAEFGDGLIQQDIKEVEMLDAEVVYNEADVNENSIKDGERHGEVDNDDDRGSKLDASKGRKKDQGIKEAKQETKVEISESNEKQNTNGSGQQVLGEVATLLKQVQESDEKARLEVEVKVRKMDQGN